MRVLVIEDSDIDFQLVQRALGDQFTLSRSTSLAIGLKMANEERFDLVILDLTLDDSSGFETFEKAKAALAHTAIVVLSGIDDDELAMRAVSRGAQDYVPKSRLLDFPLDRTAKYAIERNWADKKVRESERFASSIVNSLASHIAILDETGTILAANTAWHRFAESENMSSIDHGVGANYLTVCEEAGGEDAQIARAAADGIRSVLCGDKNSFYLEYPCHAPTKERWFMMQVRPFDGDGPTRAVVSHEDITLRKIAERVANEQLGLRAAVAAMEHVLGVVGHELRTPLAALRAISEYLILDGAKNTAEADRFLHEISEEVDRMSDTVNNLLEAARLNSGRAKWNWSQIDIVEIIDEAVSSIQPLIDSTRVLIEANVDPAIGTMLGDAGAIRRLLINLLSNSRKHTTEGQIEVHGRQRIDANGAWVELIVTDSGCGIPPEVSARLGEAFALNSGVVGSNHVNGTGLGLAICKGIVKAHGGELLVDSTLGHGTTITARLRSDLPKAATGDTVYPTPDEEIAA